MKRFHSLRHAGHPARMSPRMRWAAIVYAVIVVLGLAGTGAHALWSQSGSVATTVTTGTWGAQPITTVSCAGRIDMSWWTDVLVVGYTAPEGADQVEAAVTMGSKTVATSRQKVVPGGRYSTDLTVPLQTMDSDTFRLTLTPSAQGTPGQPTVRTVTMHNKVNAVVVQCSAAS